MEKEPVPIADYVDYRDHLKWLSKYKKDFSGVSVGPSAIHTLNEYVTPTYYDDLTLTTKYVAPTHEDQTTKLNIGTIEKSPSNDDRGMINHPKHYSDGIYEVINIIDHYKLDFSLGNAVKYILRAGVKDINKEIEDLEKAKWYIQHKIDLLNKNDTTTP